VEEVFDPPAADASFHIIHCLPAAAGVSWAKEFSTTGKCADGASFASHALLAKAKKPIQQGRPASSAFADPAFAAASAE
jgi:hypothetical protein